ncbi:MAG: polymerase subunit gamma/tau, partial [Patescibacteria group bacterium]|nr:polymerase subunit gamma/tau [Patescibacteria group bacterium]
EVEASLGRQYSFLIPQLAQAVIEKNTKQTMEIFEDLRKQGAHEVSFHKDLVDYLHTQLLIGAKVAAGKSKIAFDAARFLLLEISTSELSQPAPLPFLRLELKLLEIIDRALRKNKPTDPPRSAPSLSAPTSQKAVSSTSSRVKAVEITEAVSISEKSVSTLPAPITAEIQDLSGNGELLYQQWQTFVSQVAQTNFSLATLLKSAQPLSGETGKITLGVYYKFHQEQLLQPKFTQQLNDLISSNYGGPVQIQCILNSQPSEAELTEPETTAQLEKLATDALM